MLTLTLMMLTWSVDHNLYCTHGIFFSFWPFQKELYDSLGDKILTLTKTWPFSSYCDIESKVKVTKTYHTFGNLLDMKLH